MTFSLRVLGSYWAQLSLIIAGALTTVLVARVAGPSGAGGYTLAVQFGVLAVVAGSLGLDLGVIYHTGRGDLDDADFRGSLLWTGAVWGVLLAALTLLAGLALRTSALKGVDTATIAAAAASVPFALIARYQRAFLLGRSRVAAYNAVQVVLAVATVVFVAVALFLGRGVQGAVWGFAAANLVAALLAIGLAPGRLRPAAWPRQLGRLRQLAAYGLKAQAANFLQFFSYRLDLALVNALLGLTAAGYYSIATLLAETIWYLPAAVALVLTPRIAAGDRRDAERFTPLICRTTVMISAVSALVLAALAPLLVTVLFGPGFLPAVVPLWLLLPGVVALSLDKPIASFQLGQGRPQISLYVALLATPVTVAAYVLLIPPFGLAGAALGSSLSYVATTLIELGFLRRVSQMPLRQLIFPLRADWRLYRETLRDAAARLAPGLAARPGGPADLPG